VEPAALKRAGTVTVAVMALAAGALLWRARLDGNRSPVLAEAPSGIAPRDARVRVEVVNTTRTRGLGRRAMFALRDAGFDVVRLTTDTLQRDSTLVLDRSGHADWAQLVARALGAGRVVSRPDSSRYLDVSVLLGRDWRPPAKPFYP
jgi:hypothetical protein